MLSGNQATGVKFSFRKWKKETGNCQKLRFPIVPNPAFPYRFAFSLSLACVICWGFFEDFQSWRRLYSEQFKVMMSLLHLRCIQISFSFIWAWTVRISNIKSSQECPYMEWGGETVLKRDKISYEWGQCTK